MGVDRRYHARHRAAAVAGWDARVILHAVLDEEGHAGQRPGQRPGDLRARLRLHQPHDGVDAAVHTRVLGQREVEQFGRADRATGHMLGQGGRVAVEVVGEVHAVFRFLDES